MWYAAYLGSPGSTGDRDRLSRELDLLRDLGVENLRILALSEASPSRRSVRPAVQPLPGVFDDSLLIGLDHVLAELADRDMHAVLYLGNYWEWSGGFTQYNVWAGGKLVDPETTGHTWDEYMDYAGSFYANSAAQAMYREAISRIVTRVNSVNGRRYSEDPAIMAWQLANEPRPGTVGGAGKANLPDYYRWIGETAAFIDSLDPRHLISTGSEGVIGSLVSEEYFVEAHRSPHIDYLTFHIWPNIWGWFDPDRDDETIDSAISRTQVYVLQHVRLARLLGKPLVMDEFGLGRDGRQFRPGTATEFRDRYYGSLFHLIEDSAEGGSPLAGSNFWAWGGEGAARHETGKWQPGDPLTGDPPHEPQGMHSVFSSDTTTQTLIARHAAAMRRRGSHGTTGAYGTTGSTY
jgi:mannan endo-1,4-beta-mannosidase